MWTDTVRLIAGQLFIRLLTANFEEAVAARAEKRPAVFTDDK